jgi:hypothetical protein
MNKKIGKTHLCVIQIFTRTVDKITTLHDEGLVALSSSEKKKKKRRLFLYLQLNQPDLIVFTQCLSLV